jgi:hypothetical protein
MNRAEARQAAFERDNFKCVFCGKDAVDAHHLLERRLWPTGGYLLDNLISVCTPCHLLCESTALSVEEGRKAASITNIVVPEHMYRDVSYDKWGNILLDTQRTAIGELFFEDNVQRFLRDSGRDIVPYVKYPRTFHLPWSHPNRDDKVLSSISCFTNKRVIVTEKMDGECMSLYTDYLHARSIDSAHRKDQSWMRSYHAKMGWSIPENFRVCGEYLYARHSIQYSDLETYFYGFSVWDGLTCLSWPDTLEWFELLEIQPVRVLWEGVWNEKEVRSIELDEETQEGYVVRLESSFEYKDFKSSVAKYVRPNHVQTHERWARQITPNELRKDVS